MTSNREQLEAVLTAWKESMMLANTLYSHYRDYRAQADSYESQLLELIDREPISDAGWAKLIKRLSTPRKES